MFTCGAQREALPTKWLMAWLTRSEMEAGRNWLQLSGAPFLSVGYWGGIVRTKSTLPELACPRVNLGVTNQRLCTEIVTLRGDDGHALQPHAQPMLRN